MMKIWLAYEILLYYFRVIDPLSINKQGNDVGRQYRTGIYYINDTDVSVISEVVRARTAIWPEDCSGGRTAAPLCIGRGLSSRLPQEELSGYCHINVNDAYQPLVDPGQYEKPSENALKENLSEEAYQVTNMLQPNDHLITNILQRLKKASM